MLAARDCGVHSWRTLLDWSMPHSSITPPTKLSTMATAKTRWSCGFVWQAYSTSRAQTLVRHCSNSSNTSPSHHPRSDFPASTGRAVAVVGPLPLVWCCLDPSSEGTAARRHPRSGARTRQEEARDRSGVAAGTRRDGGEGVLVCIDTCSPRNQPPQEHEGCHPSWTLPTVLFLSPL